MTSFRIEVNHKLCMGAGECVYSAPNSFALSEENKAIVMQPELDSDEAIQTAARGCPNFAIRLHLISAES